MIQVNKYFTLKKLLEWNIDYSLGLKTQKVKKGEVFLQAGQKCNYMFFTLRGSVRIYYYDLKGNDMTHWFVGKDSIFTSPFSFFREDDNILHFEALEETNLILITAKQLRLIGAKVKGQSEAMQSIYMDFGMLMSRRVMSIHTETAEKRYLRLLEEHPYIFQQAKLSQIASYLGITPQSLSRIRKNL